MDKDIKDLSVKINRLIELQELILKRLNQGVVLSNEPIAINLVANKLSKKEEHNQRMNRFKEDIQLKFQYGGVFQRQFNLVVQPSVDRIRAYLRNNDDSAFDGLKRNKK